MKKKKNRIHFVHLSLKSTGKAYNLLAGFRSYLKFSVKNLRIFHKLSFCKNERAAKNTASVPFDNFSISC